MSELEALPRLVFICLWSMADDEGRLEGNALAVWRFGSFREDSREIARALDTLARLRRVVLYEVEGNPYIAILNFNKHQKIDHPSKSKIPAPSDTCDLLANPRESSRELDESSRILAPDQGSGIKDQGSKRAPKKVRAPAAERPDDVPTEIWEAWTAQRRKKGASLSSLVIDEYRREAARAGVTLAEAMRVACVRGWQGFKAEWYLRDAAQPGKPVEPVKPWHQTASGVEKRGAELGITPDQFCDEFGRQDWQAFRVAVLEANSAAINQETV